LEELEAQETDIKAILDDLGLHQFKSMKLFEPKETELRQKDDNHHQLLKFAQMSGKPTNVISAARAEVEAMKLKPKLLELSIGLWEIELLIKAKDEEHQSLKKKVDGTKVAIVKLERRLSDLGSKHDAAVKEWDSKWITESEVEGNEDMGSMDGDIDDDCASEITNNDSLDDKDWKNEYLAAKLAESESRCGALIRENSTLQEHNKLLKQKKTSQAVEAALKVSLLESQLQDCFKTIHNFETESKIALAKQADATEERLNTALIETADKADTGK